MAVFSFADVQPGADLIQAYDFSRSSIPVLEYTLTILPDTDTVLHLVEFDPQIKFGSIEGHVQLNTSGTLTPLANALVSVSDSPVRALTDSAGHYRLDAVPIGARKVTVLSPPPQNLQTKNATVQEGLVLPLDFVFLAAITGPRSVRGLVLDPFDRPVPGAGVAEFDSSGNVVRSAVADASGNYVVVNVPPGVHAFSALGQDNTSGTLRSDVGAATVNVDGLTDASLTIRLLGFGTIQGKVVGNRLNDIGNPVDSPVVARVTLSAGRLVKVGQFGFIATGGSPFYLGDAEVDSSASDGTYSFSNILGGPYQVLIHHPIYGDKTASGTLGAAQTLTQDFRYDNALAWIDGFLYDQSGAPITGADVDLWQGAAPSTRTDSRAPPYATVKTISDPADPRGLGYFRFISLPNRSFTLAFQEVVNGVLRFDQAYVTVGSEPHAIRVTLRTRVVQDVRVTIKQPDGNGDFQSVALAAVSLQETDWPARTFRASTDSSGIVLFPGVSEGRFTINAQKLSSAGSAGGCVCVDGGTVGVTLVLPGTGSVKGTVRFPGTSTPVASAQVLVWLGSTPVGAAQTDSNGQYQIDGVELNRTFSIRVKDASSARSGFGNDFVVSSNGEITTRDVTLLALGSVQGRFTDAGGTKAIPGATVTLTSDSLLGRTIFYSGTDGGGNFTIAGVPQGTYSISSQDPLTRLSGRNDGRIDLEGVTVTTDVKAQASGTIDVSVSDAAGAALSIPSVVTLSVAGMPARTIIASTFRFTDVLVGSAFTITAEEQVSPPKHRAVASGQLKANGESQSFALRWVPYGSVNVHVIRDGTGADVSRGSVAIYNAGVYQGQFPFDQWVQVDAQGRGSFVAVGGGPLTAKYWDPVTRRYTTGTGQLSAEGSTIDITITVPGLADVTGRVMKPAPSSSEPAPGTYVTLDGRTVVTATDGRFLLDGTAAGSYSIDFRNDTLGGRRSVLFSFTASSPTFDTGDVVLDGAKPSIVQLTPPDGTTGLSRTQPIQILFSKPIRVANGNAIQAVGPDHTKYGSVTLSGDRRTLYWSPGGGFQPATTYRFHVGTDAILDDAGWLLDVVWNSTFSTIDDRGPVVAQTAPIANAIQVPGTTTVVALFDSAIDPASIRSSSIVVEKTRPTAAVVSGTVAQGANALTVVFTPSAVLDDEAGYKVTISGLKNTVGNAMYAPYVFSFSTTDNTSPSVTIDPLPNQLYTGGNYSIGLSWTSTDIQAIQVKINGYNGPTFYPSPSDRTAKFTDYVRDSTSPRVFAATPTDFSGNTGATVRLSVPVVVDPAPTVTIQITSATSLAVGGTLTGQVAATDDRGLSTLSLSISGPLWGSFNWTDVAGQTTATRPFSIVVPNSAAAGGTVTLQAYVYDNSDARQYTSVTNTSATILRDTVPPVISNVSPASGANVVAGSRVVVSADLTDNTGILFFSSSGASSRSEGYSGSRWSVSFTAPSTAGPFSVVLTATDLGNNATSLTLPLNAGTDNPPSGTITITPSGTILPNRTFSARVDAADDHSLAAIRLRATGADCIELYPGCVTGSLSGTSSWTSKGFRVKVDAAAGSTVSVFADIDDAQGHTTTVGPVNVIVAVDTTAPVLSGPKPDSTATIYSGQAITISVTANDDVDVASVDLTVDGFGFPIQKISDWICPLYQSCYTRIHWDASYRAKVVSTPTIVPIRFTAHDRAGNIGTLDHQITITSLAGVSAPTVALSCPTDGALLPAGYATTLSATTTDDGLVQKIEFYQNADTTPFFTTTSPPYQTTYTIPAALPAGSTVTLRARSYDYANNTSDSQAVITLVAGTVLSTDTVILAGDTSYDGQTLIIRGGTTTIAGSHPYANLVVLLGARVNSDPSSVFTTSLLDLTRVTGKVYVACGGSIDVSGKGYLGGGVAGNSSFLGRTTGNVDATPLGTGGSHGGLGEGAGTTVGSNGGAGGTYGNLVDPSQPGAGGGRNSSVCCGGSGGGVIRLAAAAVIVDGKVSSNGEAGGASGGAGGSIRIDGARVSGGGTIEANGASGNFQGPFYYTTRAAGGGGRIAIYGDLSQILPRHLSAGGGLLQADFQAAGADTVYLRPNGSTYGQLFLDNLGIAGGGTPLLSIGPGTVTGVAGSTITDSAKDFVPEVAGLFVTVKRGATTVGTYRIVSASHAVLTLDTPVAGIVQVGDAYAGLLRLDQLTARNGASLTTTDTIEAVTLTGSPGATQAGFIQAAQVRGTTLSLDAEKLSTLGPLGYAETTVTNRSLLSIYAPSAIGDTTISGASTFSGNAPITAGTWSLTGGSLMTHDAATDTAATRLDVTTSGAMTIDATSSVDVSMKGYLPGRTLGNATMPFTNVPGLYGGVGGGVSQTGYAALVYGSFADPRDLGSGGSTGKGGGSVHLGAASLLLDGRIVADGEAYTDRPFFPGAGGSVRIDAASLIGSGSISATGGVGNNYVTSTGYKGGAAGGGRIAIYADTANFDRSKVKARGGFGPSYFGGPGTVFFKSPSQSFGELIVENGGFGSPATPLPAIGSGTLTAVSGSTITDSSKTFPNSIFGLYVQVSHAATVVGTYRIVAQNGATLTLDQSVQGVVLAGDTYRGVLRLDSIVVASGSSLQTPDTGDAHWLVLNPEAVYSEGASTGTVVLSSAAPAGGAAFMLSSSNTSAATVPASVTVPAGGTSANFTVTALTAASPVSVVISAARGGLTKSAILTVLGPGTLSSVTLNPTSAVGGYPATGTLTLTGSAPTGGAVVTLSSSNPAAATVPATVTVPAGAASASFTVTTLGVSSASSVTITAVYSGVTRTASLTVTPAALETLGGIPPSVVGGNSSTPSITLTGAAPPGGAVVTLTNSNPSAATVPSTVVVPAGASSATFTIATVGVATTSTVNLSASYAGVSKAGSLDVVPATFYSFTLNPTTLVGGASSAGTVSLNGKAGPGGVAVTLSSSDTSVATVPASITVPAGASSAAFSVTTLAVSVSKVVAITVTDGLGLQTVNLTVNAAALSSLSVVPLAIVGGNTGTGTVTLTGAAPAGGALVTLGSSNTAAATVPASVTVAAGASSATFTVTTLSVASPTTSTISGVYAGVTRSQGISVKLIPPPVSSFVLSPSTIVGGNLSYATVTLAAAAPTGDAILNLSSSNTAAATVPGSGSYITILAGTTSFSFGITTYGVSSSTTVTLTAMSSGPAKTATLTVTPAALSAVSLSPAALAGGAPSTGTVTLSGKAATGGAVVTLSSSNTSATTVPANVSVAAGATSATFTVTTLSVASSTSVAISAVYSGVTQTAVLTVNPPPPPVSSLIVSPSSVVGGSPSTGTVTLSTAAPTGGSIVTLSSSNTAAATVPASVTVAAGATSAGFTVTTLGVASSASVTISATSSGVAKTAALTVTPAALSALSVNPSTVVGGTSSILTLSLTGKAPPGGAAVTLSSSNTSAATIGATATVTAGASSTQLTVPTFLVASSIPVTITGVYSGVTKTVILTVNPSPPAVSSLTLSPTSVPGGSVSTGTVTLAAAAPSGGTVVALSSSNTAAAATPASMTVPAAATSATFPVTARNVASSINVTISATSSGVTKTATLTVTPCTTAIASPPASLPAGEVVWVEDQVPPGVNAFGTWTWDATQKASGTQSHTEPGASGLHYHGFDTAWANNFYVEQTDTLTAWVLVDPCDPPQEILLQWEGNTAGYRQAFWGADLIAWGTLGVDRIAMGPLPTAGQWVRLDVPASTLGLGGSLIGGYKFTLYDGHVWWDRVGKLTTCTALAASAPASLPPDTVWIEDAAPAGGALSGTWTWDATQKASGAQSHHEPPADGVHQHSVDNAWSSPLNVGATDKLVCYVLIDPCDPPQEIMLQWDVEAPDWWEHRAFWGSDLIDWGAPGTAARVNAGVLPATGQWVRLEVLASSVGLAGRSVYGMAFTLYDGHAWFDRAGKITGSGLPTIAALSVSPPSVAGGATATGTATLTGAAPAGGQVVTLSSSNTGIATVPSSVTVAGGATSATFAVATLAVGADTSVTITGTSGSDTRSAVLGVSVSPAALSSVSVSPASVVGGNPSTGTVTLTAAAPAGGAVVTLSSSNTAAATMPVSVTVAAGASTATFTATSLPVGSSTAVTISAVFSGVTKTVTLTVTPAAPSSIGLSPTSVVGGNPSTGTVTLTGAAPAGGAVVTLSNSNTAAATVPASVTVAASSFTATFTVSTLGVASSTSVTISAVYSGVTKTAALTVTPAALSAVSVSPTSVVGGSPSTGTVTLTGPAPAGGSVVTLSSSNTTAATVPTSVTVAAGTTTATFTVTSLTVASSTTVTVSSVYAGVTKTATLTVTPSAVAALSSVGLAPASVVGGNPSTGTVTLTAAAPAGGAVVTLSSSNTAAATVPVSVTVAAGATTVTFTVTTLGVAVSTSSTITGVGGGVTKTATLTVTPAALSTVALSPTTVTGGSPSTATVTLTGNAPAGGAVVTLSSSNTAAATVPASVTVAAGATTATFTVTTLGVAASTSVTITGVGGGVTKTATLTVTPAVLSSVSVSPPTVIGGTASTGTVTLTGAAATGGAVVTFSSSNTAAATVPANVTVATGASTATFAVTTLSVASSTSVTISGVYSGVTKTATLTVNPPVAAVLSTVSLSPASVAGGNPSTGTVTLTAAAPAGGTAVTLSSSNTAAATVPASVVVAAGATTATFVATTLGVASAATVTITATYASVPKTATLTVNPAAISAVSLSPTAVTSGTNSTGTVTLTGKAQPGGAVVTLSSSDTALATVLASVTVAANATSGTFTVTTLGVASAATVTITATYASVPKTATLTVNPAAISAVSVAPASVIGGTNSAGTVTLTGKAPAGGAMVTLSSSNTAAATVPASVTVAANATTATFTATTFGVASSTAVTITATYASLPKTATLTVTLAGISSVTISPTSVVGGSSSTGTVTLTGSAPAGAAVVTLTSSNTAAATVPASITVAAGATSGTFTAATLAVASSTSVTITATGSGVSKTATLTVTPPAASSVTLSPATVIGGASSTGTVTLTGPAPTGGTSVTLSSSNTASATVPASTAVTAGSTTATFTVTSLGVMSSASVTISATAGGATKTATLTVNPASLIPPPSGELTEGGASGWGTFAWDSAPASASDDTSFIRVGAKSIRFDTASGSVTGLFYPAISGNIHWDLSGVHYVTFWAYAIDTSPYGYQQGPTLVLKSANGTFVYDSSSVSINLALNGWHLYQVPLEGDSVWTRTTTGTPTMTDIVQIEIDLDTWDAGFTVYFDGLQFVQALPGDLVEGNASQWGSFAPVDLAAKSVADDMTHVIVGSKSIRFDTASGYDTGVRYPAAGNAHWDLTGADTLNFWAYAINTNDGGFQDVQPNVVLKTATGSYTYTAQGTLMTLNAWHLYEIPLAGGAPWALTTSGSPTLSDVNQIEIHQDTWGAGFTIYYDGLTFGGPAVGIASNPATVVGGNPASATVTLSAPAPAGGTSVTLSSSSPSVASIPAAVTVAAGATSAIVNVTTTAVAATTPVTLSSTSGGMTKTAVLNVAKIGISGISFSAASVVGGNSSTATITLSGNAPAGGALVVLSSSDSNLAAIPISVTVPAGAATAAFTVTTNPVGAPTPATITAVYAGMTQAATLTVTP